MIIKFFNLTAFAGSVLLTTVLLISSCSSSLNNVDVSGIAVNTQKINFDKILFDKTNSFNAERIGALRNGYPYFFDLFVQRIIHLPPSTDSLLAVNLAAFVNDRDVQAIDAKTRKVFSEKDVNDITEQVNDFLKHYQFYFNRQPVKYIVTYVSAFNYNIITTDSLIGIGLDMYLGADCEFYPSLEIPFYVYQKYSKAYILNDCIKGWFQSEYDVDNEKKELLSQMIYYGKQLYFTEAMAPQLPDTIKVGYSAKQLAWCQQNIKQMWGFYIEHKLLYQTNEKEYMKYIADGNTTQGFPEGAPAKTAQYLGWQIVKAYMKNNTVSLPNLMAEKDAQKILQDSGFKP
jgi:hypothetical protein